LRLKIGYTGESAQRRGWYGQPYQKKKNRTVLPLKVKKGLEKKKNTGIGEKGWEGEGKGGTLLKGGG